MPTQTYDFSVPAEYTISGVDLSSGSAVLAPTVLTGTVLCNVLFKGIRLDAFAAAEAPGGGTILYGLEIDAVLRYYDGAAWAVSNGSAPQLNTLAQVQANLATAIGLERPIVKPFVRLTRPSIIAPSPQVDDIVADYTEQVPNRQVLLATDAAVALNTGVGGVPSPGETRVTMDPLQVAYIVGTNELWVFRNGILQPPPEYIEEDSSHVVFTSLLDAIGPDIDEVEFRTALAGTSLFLPAPISLSQARAPERPDNFGGNFGFV